MLRVVGQQCCVHLHGKDMLGIVVQQFCFRAHGSNTIEHHSHSLQKKKKRHKPSGDVRGVYDVILYGCAVILFSSGRQVSENCKIKMTRKSLLSDFSRIKNIRNAVYHVAFCLTKFRKEWCLLSRIFIQCFLLLLCISWNSNDERLINRSSSSYFHIFWEKLCKKLLYSNVQHLIDYQVIIRITLYQRIKSNQILKLASN